MYQVIADIDIYLVLSMKIQMGDLLTVSKMMKQIDSLCPLPIVGKVEIPGEYINLVLTPSFKVDTAIGSYENNEIHVTFHPKKPWVDIRQAIHEVIWHEYIHRLQEQTKQDVDEVTESFKRINNAIKAIEIAIDNAEKEGNSIERLNKELSIACKRYYFNTLEKASHAGQIMLELLYNKLDKAEFLNPVLVKSACLSLLNTNLSKLVQETRLWDWITSQIPKSVIDKYLDLVIKEGRRIMVTIVNN